MKIKTIGFGYTKNLGNYENCKLYLEAELEDWEDSSESLNHLRDRVAQELNLPDKWHDLKGKFTRQLAALEINNAALTGSREKLKKAQEEWEKYEAFLIGHGIDPGNLRVNTAPTISLEEAAKIARELDAEEDAIALRRELDAAENMLAFRAPYADDSDDCDPDPYYGDEYDRLHNSVIDDESENSYF